MSGPIKIRIQGSDALDDAPDVEDFLRQVSDFLDVLKGVEEAIAGDSGVAIKWRVTNASRKSPVEIEATPFPAQFGVNIDQRVLVLETALSAGLAQIASGGPRPPFFPEPTLAKVERMAERVLNGLARTQIIFDNGIPEFNLTKAVARQTSSGVRAILNPVEKPYEELGSVEGFYAGVIRDGFGGGRYT